MSRGYGGGSSSGGGSTTTTTTTTTTTETTTEEAVSGALGGGSAAIATAQFAQFQLQPFFPEPLLSNYDEFGNPQIVDYGGVVLQRIAETRKNVAYAKAARNNGDENASFDNINGRIEKGMFMHPTPTRVSGDPINFIDVATDEESASRLGAYAENTLATQNTIAASTASSFSGSSGDTPSAFSDETDAANNTDIERFPRVFVTSPMNVSSNHVGSTAATEYFVNLSHLVRIDNNTDVVFNYQSKPDPVDVEYKWIVQDVRFVEGTGNNLAKVPEVKLALKTSIDRAANIVPILNETGTVIDLSIDDKGQFNGTGQEKYGALTYRGMKPPEFEKDPVLVSAVTILPKPQGYGGEISDVLGPAALAANLDISNCLQAADDLMNKGLDKFKNAIKYTSDAAGLTTLMNNLNGLKDDLKSRVPKIPEIPDFAIEFAKLDFNTPEAVKKFKERWGDIVSDIDTRLAQVKLPSFSICTVKEEVIKADIQPDGTLKKANVIPEPVVPTEAPVVDKKTSEVVTTVLKEDAPITQLANQYGISPKDAHSALLDYSAATQDLYNTYIPQDEIDAYDVAMEAISEKQADIGYQKFKAFRKNQGGPADYFPRGGGRGGNTRAKAHLAYIRWERETYPDYIDTQLKMRMFTHVTAKLKNYIRRNAYKIVTSGSIDAWTASITGKNVLPPRAGSYIQATHAVYDQSSRDAYDINYLTLLNLIESNIWNNDLILGLAKWYFVSASPGASLQNEFGDEDENTSPIYDSDGFKPHTMYDSNGVPYEANTEEDHKNFVALGYTHSPPSANVITQARSNATPSTVSYESMESEDFDFVDSNPELFGSSTETYGSYGDAELDGI